MIQTSSEQEAMHMNQLLWTFRDQSFIPHELLPRADMKTTPVIIGWGGDAAEECDVLINLATEILLKMKKQIAQCLPVPTVVRFSEKCFE